MDNHSIEQEAFVKVPYVGYDAIIKVLRGYHSFKRKASRADIASNIAMKPNKVSMAAKFLMDIGVLSHGKDKELTATGRTLSSSIINGDSSTEMSCWLQISSGSDRLQNLVLWVEAQSELTMENFASKLCTKTSQTASKDTRAGANAILKILKQAGILEIKDGKIVANAAQPPGPIEEGDESKDSGREAEQRPPTLPQTPPPLGAGGGPQFDPNVHIDIQIHVSPDTSTDQIDKIFESMAKHIYKIKPN